MDTDLEQRKQILMTDWLSFLKSPLIRCNNISLRADLARIEWRRDNCHKMLARGRKEIKSEPIGAFYWRSSFGQTTLHRFCGWGSSVFRIILAIVLWRRHEHAIRHASIRGHWQVAACPRCFSPTRFQSRSCHVTPTFSLQTKKKIRIIGSSTTLSSPKSGFGIRMKKKQ